MSGLDTNPCSVASPCRSFAAALAATVIGGEIVALDSAGYGPFTIAQDVTVTGAPGVHAAITATSGNAITINSGVVFLGNLFIIGNGVASYGIRDFSTTLLHVFNCVLEGFASAAIQSLGSGARVVIDHTLVEGNITGIWIVDGSGAIENSSVNACGVQGILVEGDTAGVVFVATLTNFRFDSIAFKAETTGGGGIVEATLDRCSISSSATTGVDAIGSVDAVVVLLMDNVIDGIQGSGNYTMYSAGNNLILSTSGATLAPFPLK